MHSIYQLEQRANKTVGGTIHDPESSPLLESALEDSDNIFTRLLDKDLEQICEFYTTKEHEIFAEVDALLTDEENYKRLDDAETGAEGSKRPGHNPRASHDSLYKVTSGNDAHAHNDDEPYHDHPDQTARKQSTSLEHEMAMTELYAQSITIKKRATSLYVTLCELRSFVQLNRTGFSKVLKKYDKTLDRKLKDVYIRTRVDTARPFLTSTTDSINDRVLAIERAYANTVTSGDVERARAELRLHLREHVVWERNTVWREMIGIERKAQAANIGIRQPVLGTESDPRKKRLQGDEPEAAMTDIKTPVGKVRCPRILLSPSFYMLICILVVVVLLLFLPIMEKAEQQNCLALVVVVSMLWATEVSMVEHEHAHG